MNRDRMKSVKVFDPISKSHYHVLLPQEDEKYEVENDITDENTFSESQYKNITSWSRTETLAIINIFSLFKDKFKTFKTKREQWNLISEELARIGICKAPEKCENKWKNLVRVYRQHKLCNKGPGRFDFFDALDKIISDSKEFAQYNETRLLKTRGDHNTETRSANNVTMHQLVSRKRPRCGCAKSEKQKRHEDRMVIMTKKMEIEERKVKAFEEYLQFLKSNAQKT